MADPLLNQTPTFTSTHVFSTADVTGTFDGLTQGTVGDGTPVVDFTAVPEITQEGVLLYPINSEFGYNVTDFVGAVEKDFVLDPAYEEGWVGDLTGAGGEQLGLVISNSPTDSFKTPALLGTWLAGLGGETIKASTEHYVVMQNILSDQRYPGDPLALYPLDDNLKMVGGEYDGWYVADILPLVGDVNGDGVVDVKDILQPNETQIAENILVGADYSVTMKDDGKLLYRWGNVIKKPNDVRIEASLDLPDEWTQPTEASSGLIPLFRITQAELVTNHTITNNPNDQIRPEDFENESAIGTLPTYVILPDGKWVTTDPYYAGDGTLYPAGTVLRDPALVTAIAGSTLVAIGATTVDLDMGFTNAWYTTMDREPFEAVLNEDGTDYIVGPRWRLQPDKYGQDLPSVDIPLDPSLPPPPTKDELKYESGADTTTVINLLDWALPVSPLSISAGFQNLSGTTSINGLNMTDNFDVAFYVKGDIKPATLYDTTLVMTYEELAIYGLGQSIEGGEGSDYLVGMGGNIFTGDFGTAIEGEDLFVLAYGAGDNWAQIVSSTILDFQVGIDTLGLIDFNVTEFNFADLVNQEVVDGDLHIDLNGFEIVVLDGVAQGLAYEDFLVLNRSLAINAVPTGSVIIDDSTPVLTQVLTATNSLVDTDGILGDVSYQWQVFNDIDDIWEDIEGAILDTYTVTETVVGSSLRVEASYVDGLGTTETVVSSPTGLVAAFNSITGTIAANTLIGTDLPDFIQALGGNDTLIGGAGNDTLDGGTGNDSMTGGTGDDVYVVDSTTDVVVELPDEGIDTVQSALLNYTLGDNVENLVLLGAATRHGTGNASNNVLTGNNGANQLLGLDGNDTLIGNGGNDTLSGGAGDDSMVGGTGNDLYFVDDAGDQVVESVGGGTDVVRTTLAVHALADQIETLRFTGVGNFAGTGNALNNAIFGGIGNDTLDGGAGNDTMTGGAGNDTYNVDSSGDVITEVVGGGTDTVISSATVYNLGSYVENLVSTNAVGATLTGNLLANQIQGSEGNDSIVGGGGNDTLNGGAGNDMLDGGTGSDSMTGGTGNDTYVVDATTDVVVELADVGIDTVQSALLNYTLGENLENLVLLGAATRHGTGNTADNVLTGNNGANLLQGMDGNDTLIGNGGNDTLIGGTGDDSMEGGTGNDIFRFFDGFGHDSIIGFDSNPLDGQDLLNISPLGVTAGNFFDNVFITADAGNTLISFMGITDTITLVGVNSATVTQQDFVLG
ncbi:MAG TPA: hypothetical protein DCY64_16805 [Hydrogenophaga sp.]|uniref:beta strand repeat-containing protein n=1 Tax=Hydrogenophaga sp. TaxID=1904254 RepID=UPI0008C263C8|nr:calcium-binding protein [Hydrogenophaga sp.]OGA79634.1 MAG: hypothetical protein A2X73_06080 [Burkholderiales bacterium GWE1_65_30]OGA92710.1 MAG: hypothetical protein A2X72_22445 [Burkholderiales bacterium GWF1_66_17]HAX21923.1 hypothetical protein [Hydrogenophaga sp.]HBU21250.1 hypothetical protein [Hydrogenophaga sp.]